MHWPDAGTQSRAHRVGKNLEGPPTDRRDMQPCSLKKNYPFFLTLSKVSERKSDKIFHKLHSLKTTRRNPSGNIIRDILTSMQRITCTKKEERRQSKIRQRASKGGKHPRSGRRKNWDSGLQRTTCMRKRDSKLTPNTHETQQRTMLRADCWTNDRAGRQGLRKYYTLMIVSWVFTRGKKNHK